MSEQPTLKRSHDQIASKENEKSEQTTQMETESASRPSALYTGSELQTKFSLNSGLFKSHPIVIPAGAGPDEESQAKNLFHIPVTDGQHGMLPPVLSPSSSANQEARNAKAVPVHVVFEGTTSSSQHLGSILYIFLKNKKHVEMNNFTVGFV